MFWYTNLSTLFNANFDTVDIYPILLFERKGKNTYEIRFLEVSSKKSIDPLDETYSVEKIPLKTGWNYVRTLIEKCTMLQIRMM